MVAEFFISPNRLNGAGGGHEGNVRGPGTPNAGVHARQSVTTLATLAARLMALVGWPILATHRPSTPIAAPNGACS